MNNKPFSHLDDTGGYWFAGRTFTFYKEMKLLKDGDRVKFDFPSRAERITFCLFHRGKSEQVINMHGYTTVDGTFIFLGAGSLFRIESIDPETRITGLSVDASLIGDLLHYNVPVMLSQYALDGRIVLDQNRMNLFISMIDNLITMANLQGGECQSINFLMAAVISFCCKEFDGMEANQGKSSREADIVNRFLHLLNLSRGRKRKVSDYSSQLCISDHHLSVTVKKISGFTVKELIDKMVIAEIKMMLTRTDKSVMQISEEMEFPNSSFMCNFFKKQEGITPLKFRDDFRKS